MPRYTENRKARFNYELLDTYETGIELVGPEVKSVRTGRATLEGAHVIVRGGEVYIVGMDIAPYQPQNTPENYDSLRTRRLLLKKKEISELERKADTKGLTIVPVSLYSKGPKIKLEIAVGKGKKLYNKRESIKKRDIDRDVQRELKDR